MFIDNEIAAVVRKIETLNIVVVVASATRCPQLFLFPAAPSPPASHF